jgi:hypothetical protein
MLKLGYWSVREIKVKIVSEMDGELTHESWGEER